MLRFIKVYCFCLGMLLAAGSYAQTSADKLLITADSLATGNYKDVFKSFFQLAFDRITSSNKQLQFSANPFAVMAKVNPDLLVDTSYVKYRHLRNLNVSFSTQLTNDYKFSGFSSGVKYALVNARDETVSKAFVSTVRKSEAEKDTLLNRLVAFANTIPLAQRGKIRSDINALFNDDLEVGQTDTTLQRKLKEFTADLNIGFDTKLNLRKLSQATYDSLKTLFQNRPLWTIGVSDTTYQDQFFFSNVSFSSEFVKGIVNPSATGNIELNARAALDLLDDTLRAGRDLKRSVFSFEPGLNFILKVKNTAKSILECKLSGSYYHTFSTLYAGEEKNRLTLNGTLRFRVMNDIWIPLEIKYDPASGNVFGFLNVRFNFNGMGKTVAKS